MCHLDRFGNYICPGDGCEFFVEIADDQDHLNHQQKQAFWMHIQNMHLNLFNDYFEKYSQVQYQTKESKVSIFFYICHR